MRNKKFTVLYSGNIELAKDIETKLKIAELLKNSPIVFEIIGDGAQRSKLEKIKAELGLSSNVNFFDPILRTELITYIKFS